MTRRPILSDHLTSPRHLLSAGPNPGLASLRLFLAALLTLLGIALLAPSTGFAQEKDVQGPVKPAAAELRWFDAEPDSKPLNIRQVIAADEQWKVGKPPAHRLSLEPSERWYRWELPDLAERSQTAWLALGNHKYQSARIWFVNQRGRILSAKETGLDLPMADRNPAHHKQLVPFTTPNRGQYTVYFQLTTFSPGEFAPSIHSPAAFEAAQMELRDQLVFGLGALLAMGVIACALTFTTQDVVIGFIGLLAISVAGWAIDAQGFAFQWLWPEDPRYNLYTESILLALVATFTTLIGANAFENLKGIGHRVLGVSQKITWVLSLAIAATVSMVPPSASFAAAGLILIPALGLTMMACIVRRVQGEPDGVTLLVGTIVLSLTIASAYMVRMGDQPTWWPVWGQEIQVALLGGFVAVSLLVIGATQRQTSRNKLASLANSTLVETQRAVQIRLEETVKARTFELEAVNDQLAKVSRVDGLTGAFNRRYFDDSLKDEVERSMRSSEPIGIVMIDLDHFKKLNDEHGHAAGDACLKEAARLAMHCAEAEDGIVARYGGEEFVAVLVNANESKAMAFAERVREAIADYEVQYEEKILRMTASLGLFCDVAREKGDEERLLREADEALYAAKDGGRNQVRVGGVALAIERAAAEERAHALEAEIQREQSATQAAQESDKAQTPVV